MSNPPAILKKIRAIRQKLDPPPRNKALAWASRAIRNSEHLQHALKVAGDAKASPDERDAAVGFLVEYWMDDEPDETTVEVLRNLERDPPNRHCLASVMQAQIELGTNDEFGALCAVDAWDDKHPRW